jgi:hypothetical protein
MTKNRKHLSETGLVSLSLILAALSGAALYSLF